MTCSIGVAVYPWDGSSYQELYHCADLALYQAKCWGKNRFARFDAGKHGGDGSDWLFLFGASIDSDQNTGGKTGDLVNYVFQILYDTNDIDDAIKTILEIVGRRF